MSYQIPSVNLWPGYASFMPSLQGFQKPSQPRLDIQGDIAFPQALRLSNGSMAYCQQMKNQEISHTSILLPITANDTGSRLLIPSMLLQGSDYTKNLLNDARTRGIIVSASPNADHIALHISGPSGNETEMLNLAMTILTRPTMDPRNFSVLKDNLMKNIQNGLSDPTVPLSETVTKALYGSDHPYGKTSVEELKDLSQQTLNSVMSVYRRAIQHPEKISIAMVAGQDARTQQLMMNQAIQTAYWYAPANREPLSSQPVKDLQPRRGYQGPIGIPNETLTRAYLFTAWRAPAVEDPDYPGFCLMLDMLKGFSGGFFKALRTERSMVYGVHQAYRTHEKGGAYEVMAREVDFSRVPEALDAMKQVVKEMTDAPPSAARLQTAKEDFTRELNLLKQSSGGIAAYNQPWLAAGSLPVHPATLKAAIDNLTPQDIQRIANRFLNTQNGFQVMGISAPKTVLHNLLTSTKGTNNPT